MDARKIAHDMRTPLNALTFAISCAQQADLSEDAKYNLSVAAKNAKALSAIVECLIETSTIGSGHLGELEEHRPLDLVTSAIDQIVLLAEQKQLRIETCELATLPPVSVDGTRIIRVLVNLLSNAARFSPVGGLIQITARPRTNDGHAVTVFSVSDQGPGVSPADVDRIFVEGVSLNKPSTGLGLTVCKEIVEAHGGRIWVEVGNTMGATFSFSIPSPAA
jgi:signal transduction histidine kinase